MRIKWNVLVIGVDDTSHRVPLLDPAWDNDAGSLVANRVGYVMSGFSDKRFYRSVRSGRLVKVRQPRNARGPF